MPSTSRWSELLKGRNGLRSLALAGGVAVHAINVYQVTTILPSVVADIGGLAYYAWNMTLFVMASIFGAALSPRRIAMAGLQRAFLQALAVFGLGTVVCASAAAMPWLLAGRTIQGLGGGLLLGLSYSAVRLVFEERLWPRAMVLISSMWGISTLIGPTIGGIFAQAGLWRWAFWSMLPIIALLAFLVHTQLADGRRQPSGAARAPLGRISVLALTVMLVSAASVAHDWRWNAAGIAAGGLLTAWVAWRDARSSGNVRLLPAGGWTPGHPLSALYACVALLSLAVTVEVFIPYFLQVIHGQSPLVAGYFMASMSFGWTTGSFVNAGRSPRTTTALVKAGPIISAVSVLCLAVAMPLPLAGLPGGAAWLLLPLLGTGLGIGLAWSHILTRVFQHAPQGQENIASAAVITVQLYALALGGALAGMITNAAGLVSPGGIQGAMQAAVAIFLSFAIGPILAAILVHRHRW